MQLSIYLLDIPPPASNGFVAQLAERTLSMCKVSGSIPDESTFCLLWRCVVYAFFSLFSNARGSMFRRREGGEIFLGWLWAGLGGGMDGGCWRGVKVDERWVNGGQRVSMSRW